MARFSLITEIRRVLWPALAPAGFSRFDDRTAWRHAATGIDVVNFQSFSPSLGARVGATRHSFSINLGRRFTHIPRWQAAAEASALTPREYECDLRRVVDKPIEQPEMARPDIWFIDVSGTDASAVIEACRHTLIRDALPWFARFDDLRELLRTLRDDRERKDRAFGFGNKPSPTRAYLMGYTALAVGDSSTARSQFDWLVRSGSSMATADVRAELAALMRQ